MDIETVLGKPGTLRRNITVSLIVAVIIAFLLGAFRNFQNEIRQIPGMGTVLDFIAPDLAAPNIQTGNVNLPERAPFNYVPNAPPDLSIERGGSSACCNSCGTGPGRGGLLADITGFLDGLTVNAAPPPRSLPAYEPPCFPRTDWTGFAKSQGDLMRAYRTLTNADWNWISNYGYPMTLSGYAQYMAESDPAFSSDIRRGFRPSPSSFTTC